MKKDENQEAIDALDANANMGVSLTTQFYRSLEGHEPNTRVFVLFAGESTVVADALYPKLRSFFTKHRDHITVFEAMPRQMPPGRLRLFGWAAMEEEYSILMSVGFKDKILLIKTEQELREQVEYVQRRVFNFTDPLITVTKSLINQAILDGKVV